MLKTNRAGDASPGKRSLRDMMAASASEDDFNFGTPKVADTTTAPAELAPSSAAPATSDFDFGDDFSAPAAVPAVSQPQSDFDFGDDFANAAPSQVPAAAPAPRLGLHPNMEAADGAARARRGGWALSARQ